MNGYYYDSQKMLTIYIFHNLKREMTVKTINIYFCVILAKDTNELHNTI